MKNAITELLSFIYDQAGRHNPDNVAGLAKVVECWNRGDAVYIKDGGGGVWVDPPNPSTQPSAAIVYPYPVAQQKPDWSCGCGTTLHGDEAACWRCGAPRRP